MTERQGTESVEALSEPQHAHGLLATLTLGSWGHSCERDRVCYSRARLWKGHRAGWLIELMGTACDSELHPAVCTRFPEMACHHQSAMVANDTGLILLCQGPQCPNSSSGVSLASVNSLAPAVAKMYSSISISRQSRATAFGVTEQLWPEQG